MVLENYARWNFNVAHRAGERYTPKSKCAHLFANRASNMHRIEYSLGHTAYKLLYVFTFALVTIACEFIARVFF